MDQNYGEIYEFLTFHRYPTGFSEANPEKKVPRALSCEAGAAVLLENSEESSCLMARDENGDKFLRLQKSKSE